MAGFLQLELQAGHEGAAGEGGEQEIPGVGQVIDAELRRRRLGELIADMQVGDEERIERALYAADIVAVVERRIHLALPTSRSGQSELLAGPVDRLYRAAPLRHV